MTGFGCKTALARQIAERHFARRHYTWFSKELNPIQNGDSSNPLKLYESIDRAVKMGDVNHPKIKDLRASLMQALDFRYGAEDAEVACTLRDEVQQAPIAQFHPELWRLTVDEARVKRPLTNSGWDEQVAPDLTEAEFQIIVD